MQTTQQAQQTPTTTSVELPVYAQGVIEEFAQAKADIKAAEAKKEQAEKVLRGLLGDADEGTINGTRRVYLATRNRTGTNRKLLSEAFPEAAQATETVTTYTVLYTE